MKKLSFISAALLAVFAVSCGKDPIPETNKVSANVTLDMVEKDCEYTRAVQFYVKSTSDSLLNIVCECTRKLDGETVFEGEFTQSADSAAYTVFLPESQDEKIVLGEYILSGTVAEGSAAPKSFKRTFKVIPTLWFIPEECLDDGEHIDPFTRYTMYVVVYPEIELKNLKIEPSEGTIELLDAVGAEQAFAFTTGAAGIHTLRFLYGNGLKKEYQYDVKRRYSLYINTIATNPKTLRAGITRLSSYRGEYKGGDILSPVLEMKVTSRSVCAYRKDNVLSNDRLTNPPTYYDTIIVSKTYGPAGGQANVTFSEVTMNYNDVGPMITLSERESVEFDGTYTTDAEGGRIPNFVHKQVAYKPLDFTVTLGVGLDERGEEDVFITKNLYWMEQSYYSWNVNLLSSEVNYTYNK